MTSVVNEAEGRKTLAGATVELVLQFTTYGVIIQLDMVHTVMHKLNAVTSYSMLRTYFRSMGYKACVS